MRLALASLVIWALPLSICPPWRHVEAMDRVFWNTRFGDFDRHALLWAPPFADVVAGNPAIASPVVFDVGRFARELVVASLVTYALLALIATAAGGRITRDSLSRAPLPQSAALLALLLPLPGAGVLAFTSGEALTDWNHGIPALPIYLAYWGVVALAVFLVLLLLRRLAARL